MELAKGKNEARLVELDGEVAVEIQLTKGQVALVDLEDWELVRHHRWAASRVCRTWYALTTWRKADGGQTKIRLHSFLAGRPADRVVDHENISGLDNRRKNLRYANRTHSCANRRSHRGSASRFKGVSPCYGRWRATASIQGKQVHGGVFDTEEEAARAYNKLALALFGPFAHLNEIED